MQKISLSVITPCYNSGKYLNEALLPLLGITDTEFIVVNDGSTDTETIEQLKLLQQKGVRIIHQQNAGPGAARNAGVAASSGDVLLFLDSDNKIKPEFIPKALDVLANDAGVGVVYAKAIFFGDDVPEHDKFEVESFSFDRLLIGNYVDMCSFVRRQTFADTTGFDTTMKGCEDWELWIQVAKAGWKFHMIEEELFYYRVRAGSVSTGVGGINRINIVNHISEKHNQIIYERFKYYARLYRKIQQKPFLFFLKFIYSKYILRKDYLPK